MVKASDLGIPSSNLESIPSKKDREDINLKRAIRNLVKQGPPERISKTKLPEALTSIRS